MIMKSLIILLQIMKKRKNLQDFAQTLPVMPEELTGTDQMQKYISKLGIRVHKGYFKPYEPRTRLHDFEVDVPIPNRCRRQWSTNLSQNQKLEIIHSVMVQRKNLNMVAKEFRVSYGAVKSLILKARKNSKFVAELFSSSNINELKYEIVSKVIDQLISADSFIDSCE